MKTYALLYQFNIVSSNRYSTRIIDLSPQLHPRIFLFHSTFSWIKISHTAESINKCVTENWNFRFSTHVHTSHLLYPYLLHLSTVEKHSDWFNNKVDTDLLLKYHWGCGISKFCINCHFKFKFWQLKSHESFRSFPKRLYVNFLCDFFTILF